MIYYLYLLLFVDIYIMYTFLYTISLKENRRNISDGYVLTLMKFFYCLSEIRLALLQIVIAVAAGINEKILTVIGQFSRNNILIRITVENMEAARFLYLSDNSLCIAVKIINIIFIKLNINRT